MATLYTDPFSSVLDGNYTFRSGAVWSVPAAGTAGFCRNAATGGFQWLVTGTAQHAAVADVRVSVIRFANSTLEGGLVARFSGSSGTENCYILDSYSTNTLEVYRFNAGSISAALGTRTSAFTNGDTVGLDVTGTGATVTLKILLNGVQLGASITDTSGSRITAAGQTGLATFEAGNIDFDTFVVEDAVAGGGSSIAAISSGYHLRGMR